MPGDDTTALLAYPLWSQATGFMALLAGVVSYGTHPLAAFLLVAASLYLAMLTYQTGRTRMLPATVTIQARGVVVDGTTVLAPQEIASAYLQPRRAGRSTVRVRARKIARSRRPPRA